MAGRIVSLTLRSDDRVSALQNMASESLKIRGVGMSIFDNKDELYDAQAVKATGFDAPEFDVQGGALFSGGSQFNGIRANDRELTITVTPVPRLAPSAIKHKLMRMISMSDMQPLTLYVEYASDDTIATYTVDVYISNVTSPIFTQSREVQFTAKMGAVAFAGPTISTDKIVTVSSNSVGFSSTLRSSLPDKTQVQERHLYLSDEILSHTNAPFDVNGVFWINLPKSALTNLISIDLINGRGDSVGLVPPSNIQAAFTSAFGDRNTYSFGVSFNSSTRRLYFLIPESGSTVLSETGPLDFTTRYKWPLGMPAKSCLAIRVNTKTLVSSELITTPITASFATERYGF